MLTGRTTGARGRCGFLYERGVSDFSIELETCMISGIASRLSFR